MKKIIYSILVFILMFAMQYLLSAYMACSFNPYLFQHKGASCIAMTIIYFVALLIIAEEQK